MKLINVTSTTPLNVYKHIALKPKFELGDIMRLSKYFIRKGLHTELFNGTFKSCGDKFSNIDARGSI